MSAGSSRYLTKRLTQSIPDEAHQDWEHHMILRLPKEAIAEVDQYLNGDESKQLALSFTHSNMRQANLRIGEKELAATVHDLPCIIEVQKTLDRKTTYKVADISQIMIATNESSSSVTQPSTSAEAVTKKELKKWHYPHGLTPPMKSARQRRFRKTKKKKFMDVPEVELELKRLLRADQEAESIRWEVVPVEDKTKDVKKFDSLGDIISSSSEEETPTRRADDKE